MKNVLKPQGLVSCYKDTFSYYVAEIFYMSNLLCIFFASSVSVKKKCPYSECCQDGGCVHTDKHTLKIPN